MVNPDESSSTGKLQDGERDWHTSRWLAAGQKREGRFDRYLPNMVMPGVHLDRDLPAQQDHGSQLPVLHSWAWCHAQTSMTLSANHKPYFCSKVFFLISLCRRGLMSGPASSGRDCKGAATKSGRRKENTGEWRLGRRRILLGLPPSQTWGTLLVRWIPPPKGRGLASTWTAVSRPVMLKDIHSVPPTKTKIHKPGCRSAAVPDSVRIHSAEQQK